MGFWSLVLSIRREMQTYYFVLYDAGAIRRENKSELCSLLLFSFFFFLKTTTCSFSPTIASLLKTLEKILSVCDAKFDTSRETDERMLRGV
jgi:hypothetical protein